MSLKFALSVLCFGLSLTAPALAAPKPPAPPAHTTAAADSTSAVAAVSTLLTRRAKSDFAGMYTLLSANMRKKVSRKEFLAGASESSAEITQMPPELRGMYALFADTHNTLGYTFAVVGPDPTNADIVLVHAFPRSAPGVVPATLKIYTVAEPGSGKMPRRAVDALGSVSRAMQVALKEQALPPAATPSPSPAAPSPTDAPPAAPPPAAPATP